MPATVVQDWVSANTGSTTSPTSVTVNLGVTATAGNTLLVVVNSDATVNTPSGYTSLVTSIHNAGCYLFGKIASGSETGVTATPTSAASTCVAIAELSGLSGGTITAQMDKNASNGSSSITTTRSTGTTAGTVQADEYAVAVWGYTASVGGALSSSGGNHWGSQTNGFTEKLDVGTSKVSGTNVGLCIAVKDLGSTGTVESTATVVPGGDSTAAESLVATFLVAAVGAAPTFPPNLEQRRRLLAGPRQLRGGGRISTPVRAQLNPPFPFTGVKQPRQPRGMLSRRGHAFVPVPAQVVIAAPPYPPQPERERIKVLRLFRGRAWAPPLDQAPVPVNVKGRVKGLKMRARVESVTPVPAQVVVNAPSYPPQSVRTRLRGLRIFRGRAATVVPAQVVVAPPAYPPVNVRARLKFARIFRARSAAPVPDQLIAPPAPHLRPHGIAPRRGHAAMPAPPQVVVAPPAYPVRPVRSRLKGLRQSRGREATMPVPPQIVIPPPPYAPVFSRLKKRLVGLFRPSVVEPVGAVCDCTTHRPNLGTTTRPGSGMTARPDSGTTSRPCSCGND